LDRVNVELRSTTKLDIYWDKDSTAIRLRFRATLRVDKKIIRGLFNIIQP